MQRLDPKSTALLVVDIQERLAPAMHESAYRQLLRGTDLLITAARLLHAPILATEQYPKGLGATVGPVLDALGPEVTRVEKTAFSAMDAPCVADFISRVAPRAVVVVGVETHVCVFQTVRDLTARGYEVHVPHDAVASRRDDDRRIGLELMVRSGAIITSSETIVFDWLQRAEGEAFKTLSKKMR
jgi:nicotinamidase-related amidase